MFGLNGYIYKGNEYDQVPFDHKFYEMKLGLALGIVMWNT